MKAVAAIELAVLAAIELAVLAAAASEPDQSNDDGDLTGNEERLRLNPKIVVSNCWSIQTERQRTMPETLYTKCSPNRIVEVMKGSPSEPKLKALSELGFSGITSIKMTSVGIEFMHWIFEIYNAETKSFHIGPNQTLRLTEEDVEIVYGLPRGRREVEVKGWSTQYLVSLAVDLGLHDGNSGTEHIDLKELRKKMDKEEGCSKWSKYFVLYAIGSLLCPNTHPRTPLKYVGMLRFEDMKEFREFNWCKHVIDHFDNGMAIMESKTPQHYIQVDLHLLMIVICQKFGRKPKEIVDGVPLCSMWENVDARNEWKYLKSLGGGVLFGKLALMPLLHPRSVVNLNDLDARNARLLESYYEATIEIAQRNLEVVRSYKESRIVLEDEEYVVSDNERTLPQSHADAEKGDGGGDTDILETQLPSFDLGFKEDFGSAAIPDESANYMGTDDLQLDIKCLHRGEKMVQLEDCEVLRRKPLMELTTGEVIASIVVDNFCEYLNNDELKLYRRWAFTPSYAVSYFLCMLASDSLK
ncbi:hypothetical protein LINPERHAP1_LOCUS24566 [Linum perenne]